MPGERPGRLPDEIAERLVEISRLILGSEDVTESVRRVMVLACASIPACDEASIWLGEDGTIRRVTATSEDVTVFEDTQRRLGEGPAITAIQTGMPVTVRSTEGENRWPRVADAAMAGGIWAVQSFPLTNGKTILGSFNLYSRAPGTFDEGTARIGAVFAEQASIALHHALLHSESVRLGEQLREALVSRAVIDQAKGILMERLGCDADAAFEAIREASQRLNRKVRDLAAEIVRGAGSGRGFAT